jgi:hypothetical protein
MLLAKNICCFMIKLVVVFWFLKKAYFWRTIVKESLLANKAAKATEIVLVML